MIEITAQCAYLLCNPIAQEERTAQKKNRYVITKSTICNLHIAFALETIKITVDLNIDATVTVKIAIVDITKYGLTQKKIHLCSNGI